jgi:hypothetical protein
LIASIPIVIELAVMPCALTPEAAAVAVDVVPLLGFAVAPPLLPPPQAAANIVIAMPVVANAHEWRRRPLDDLVMGIGALVSGSAFVVTRVLRLRVERQRFTLPMSRRCG